MFLHLCRSSLWKPLIGLNLWQCWGSLVLSSVVFKCILTCIIIKLLIFVNIIISYSLYFIVPFGCFWNLRKKENRKKKWTIWHVTQPKSSVLPPLYGSCIDIVLGMIWYVFVLCKQSSVVRLGIEFRFMFVSLTMSIEAYSSVRSSNPSIGLQDR